MGKKRDATAKPPPVPPPDYVSRDDAIQQALDGQDHAMMLQRLQRAIDDQERLRQEVYMLRQKLKAAVRKHKEAGWELSVVLHAVRRLPGKAPLPTT